MIRNIWAIGRNYADHAKELGNEVPKEPLIFLKAGSCAVFGHEVRLPAWGVDIHHEIELALQFGANLEVTKATLALDLTERHFQNLLKAKGSPWTLAKSFSESCPLAEFVTVESLSELSSLDIELKVNGEVRQRGNTSQMIFTLQRQIDYVKAHFPVVAGDLLLTGTPAGVGRVSRGDILEGTLGKLVSHQWKFI